MPGGLLDQADNGALERAASRFLGRARQTAVRALANIILKDGVPVTPELRFLNFIGAFDVVYDQENRRADIINHGAPVASSTTTVVSSVGAGKALQLATSATAPPAGWSTAGFDDSAWTSVVAETSGSGFAFPALTGSTWITERTGFVALDTCFVHRRTFTLPSGTPTGATLQLQGDDDMLDIYVNGARLGGALGLLQTTLDVSPGLLVTGTNVLAVRVRNQNPGTTGPYGVDYRLDATTSIAGLDARYVVPADLTAYQLRSEKGGASGYAGLDSGSKVPTAQLGSGTASSSTVLYGDQAYRTPPSGPSAATSVVAETSAGQSSAVGTATSYAREDHTHGTPAAGGGGTGLYTAYLCYQDQKASGTASGTFTSGAWRTRDLNTEVVDTGNHGSVASNQITLDAGTYRILVAAAVYACSRNRIRLQNITDGTTTLEGNSNYTSFGSDGENNATLAGRFTITGTKTFEIQGRCTATGQFGIDNGSGFTVAHEIYMTVEFWKE